MTISRAPLAQGRDLVDRRRSVMKAIIGVILLVFFGDVLCADNLVFESGPKSSATRTFYLRGLQQLSSGRSFLRPAVNDPRLWHEFVPVAFHVDYWDRLGWKDPFASAEWTKRQRLYAANWNAESVYTPAFVLNGREWQNAQRSRDKRRWNSWSSESDGAKRPHCCHQLRTGQRKRPRLRCLSRISWFRHKHQRSRRRKQWSQTASRFRCSLARSPKARFQPTGISFTFSLRLRLPIARTVPH